MRHYESFLKLFKCCRDPVELVCAVVNKHRVPGKVYSKHKPVTMGTNKWMVIFSIHKYYHFSTEELVMFSY